MSPITGIVPDLINPGTTVDAPVYYANQNSPWGPLANRAARIGKRDSAAGKGESDIQAKVSCLAEAVERYCLMYRGTERSLRARYSELGAAAVHPCALMNFSEHQYATRDAWNADHPGFNWVPAPFEESRAIDWTAAWSITTEQTRYLPTAYCYLRHSADGAGDFCRGDSNGCASGNTIEEAALQALMELVERDAMALFWYSRVPRPAVELSSFNEPFFDRMQLRYQGKGRRLEVLDITTDLGIPTMAAVSWSEHGEQILIGLGAHIEARIAISRAISELNQMEPLAAGWRTAPPQRTRERVDDIHVSEWMDRATIRNQPYLVPTVGARRSAAEYRSPREVDIFQAFRRCVSVLEQEGLEVLILDLTRPDIAFPTVRVTVPGLRHFWARFAPGRLYDVPVKLGWLAKPLAEAELNPIPFFL